jgi:hypothetical protein
VQHVQAAARAGGDPVELVAHVLEDRAVSLDEQQLIKIEQRVAEGDLAAQLAGRIKQGPAGGQTGNRDSRGGGLQPGQVGRQLFPASRRPGLLQVVEQGRRAPQHHVGRIAVRRLDERLRMLHLGGQLLQDGLLPEVVLQGRELAVQLGGRLPGPGGAQGQTQAGEQQQRTRKNPPGFHHGWHRLPFLPQTAVPSRNKGSRDRNKGSRDRNKDSRPGRKSGPSYRGPRLDTRSGAPSPAGDGSKGG